MRVCVCVHTLEHGAYINIMYVSMVFTVTIFLRYRTCLCILNICACHVRVNLVLSPLTLSSLTPSLLLHFLPSIIFKVPSPCLQTLQQDKRFAVSLSRRLYLSLSLSSNQSLSSPQPPPSSPVSPSPCPSLVSPLFSTLFPLSIILSLLPCARSLLSARRADSHLTAI